MITCGAYSDARNRVVLTARTGRAGLRDRLEKLGYALSGEALNQAYQRLLVVADKKPEVYDEDLIAILHDELHDGEDGCQLEYLHIYSGTSAIPTATVRICLVGAVREAAALGDGPVDAVFKAIGAATGSCAELVRYEIRSVASGTEAIAGVSYGNYFHATPPSIRAKASVGLARLLTCFGRSIASSYREIPVVGSGEQACPRFAFLRATAFRHAPVTATPARTVESRRSSAGTDVSNAVETWRLPDVHWLLAEELISARETKTISPLLSTNSHFATQSRPPPRCIIPSGTDIHVHPTKPDKES